jgi:beta-1,4-mannosyl-glycoprotein beta-1,4-N-acetylglucosaminyltransferase
MTLCLNMIVKDEAHIIEETFNKLLSKVVIDYYVICDTGSTDDTVTIIKKYFEKCGIPGEIHLHEWKNFGYNRTLALEAAYKKSDYLLIFDADDYIEGDINLKNLTFDGYMLKFGSSDSSYERMSLVKNNIVWKYIGVLHEYIKCDRDFITGYITGNYFIVSGRTSSRNKDPKKYQKDAEILEKGYYESIDNGDNLHNRYVYYCANSYLDAGIKDKAIEWYKKTLVSQGWFDERYNSCLKLWNLTGDRDYLVQSFDFNPRRVEGIYQLIRHYTCEFKYTTAMNYYNFIRNYYENKWDDLSTKLFSNVHAYTFYLPYYMIIVSEKCKDYATGIKMYSIIFEHKTIVDQWWFNNLLFNIQFFEVPQIEIEKYTKYIKSKGINDNSLVTILNEKLEKIEIKQEYYFDILIYVGFSSRPWNYTYSLTNAMGGSERAIIYLSNLFPKNWKILISGDVENETVGNITYLHRFSLNKNYSFNTIIVSRYVSYFSMYNYLKFDKLILMAHDTYFMNNISGCTKTANELIPVDKIDYIVYLTEWQKNYYQTVSHPELKNVPFKIINNGIELSLFPKLYKKIPNKFIYTSGSMRGLKRLLELWGDILEKLPDATLSICSYEQFPKNNEDRLLNQIIKNNKSIEHLGKLNQKELYNLMDSAEYWLYPCSFNETSCITAMEMLMSEVICLYYPIGGLTDTMGKYGIKIQHGNEIESLQNLSLPNFEKLKKEGKEYALTCSWDNRVKDWLKILPKRKLLFYGSGKFPEMVLDDYINSLNTEYHAVFTNEIKETDHEFFDELVFVHYLPDELPEKFKEISYFNTEPLNLAIRYENVKNCATRFPQMKIYDYSLTNKFILESSGIKNVHHLGYLFNETENAFLKELLKCEKIYDFGIICAATDKTNENFTPPRRNALVKNLIKNGFTVNIICGFGKERDIQLAKCKRILNIHGQHGKINSTIFEHLRCNRLLDAGFSILSENCEGSNYTKYPNLEFQSYETIFNLNKNNDNLVSLKPNVIDCFTFYNELDMLEYRLKTLENVVDYFVIVEATLTHVGKSKEMYFEKFKERSIYTKCKKKIIHVIVDDFPFPEVNSLKNEQWKNEKFQRNCITRGLSQIQIKPDDIIVVSDVDEILNPCTLQKIKSGDILLKNVADIEQDFYYYNLESKMDHLWYFSKMFRWKWFLTTDYTLDDLRMKSWGNLIRNGGWHLSYFGDSSFISNKIKNFAHQEYNSEGFTEISIIDYRIKNKLDIYNRNIKISTVPYSENDNLPPDYFFFVKNKSFVYIQPHVLMGLGNCLFLIAVGIYYAEKYNYTLVLDSENDCLQYGTANMFNRKQLGNNYFETIYKNITKSKIKDSTKIHRDFECNKYSPQNGENLLITGYNQNIDSFFDIKDKITDYIYLNCPTKKEYIRNKYQINKNQNNVFIGLRLDTDGGFKYSNLSFASYKAVMDTIPNARFFIVSDIDPTEYLINNTYPVTIVDECDIDQIYLGLECSHFVLSESTFHYWIAIFSKSKSVFKTNVVYVFDRTELILRNVPIDFNNRNLIKGLGWNIVPQVEDSFDFYYQKDQPGHDIYRKEVSVPVLKELALADPNAVAFNTIGWIKNGFTKLEDFKTFGVNEGVYVKRKETPKKYIFIHSCSIHGTKMLEYLISSVSNLVYECLFINNIGPPITQNFGDRVVVTNYSDNQFLFEAPTLNKLRQFSIDNPGCYVLYLHTKGVHYNFTNDYVNDWINMMLYFLTKGTDLLRIYETIGCNYYQTNVIEAHWSGNFWWARSDYIKGLPQLEEKSIQRFTPEYYLAERWLFKNQPHYYELHKSSIHDHYQERYPKEKYI